MENQARIDGRREGQKPGRNAIGQEPPGYSQPPPGSLAGADAKALNLNGQVPTRTWWGDVNTGSTGFPSPRSIPGQALASKGSGAASLPLHPLRP